MRRERERCDAVRNCATACLSTREHSLGLPLRFLVSSGNGALSRCPALKCARALCGGLHVILETNANFIRLHIPIRVEVCM